MSIAKRVMDSIDKMEKLDYENALFSICAAIEATASKEFSKKGKQSYKNFIHQNLGLITNIAFGGTKILNINLGYDHPSIKKNPDGLSSIQDILYHAIRCDLYHIAKIPDDIEFSKENKISVNNGKIVLPASLIYGLIISVVISPSNKDEKCSKDQFLNLWNFCIPINKLWGHRNKLIWLMDVLSEVMQIQSQASHKE